MEKYIEKYKNRGLKLTPQRLAILDYLNGNTKHPSAEDIYKVILKKFPTMSFATVYNTMEALKQMDSVFELTIDSGKKRFDLNTEPHHHLICINCKLIVDIHNEYKLTISDSDRADFEIVGSHVEFYGTCPKCRQIENKAAK